MRDDAQHIDQHLLAGVLHQLVDAHILEPHAHLAAVLVRAGLDVRPARPTPRPPGWLLFSVGLSVKNLACCREAVCKLQQAHPLSMWML